MNGRGGGIVHSLPHIAPNDMGVDEYRLLVQCLVGIRSGVLPTGLVDVFHPPSTMRMLVHVFHPPSTMCITSSPTVYAFTRTLGTPLAGSV